jgi:thiol:disulfide interchange protein
MELGVLSGVGMTIFAAWLVSRGLPASDIALLVGAIGTAVGAWLAWSQQVYVKKSISRGPDQPTGREQ